MDGDRRLKLSKLATPQVPILNEWVDALYPKRGLNMEKFSASWVPRLVTHDQNIIQFYYETLNFLLLLG